MAMAEDVVQIVQTRPETVVESHLVGLDRIPLLLRHQPGAERRPAVIMLHGWGGNKERFQKMLPLDASFVGAYLDLPGHGQRPPAEEQADEVRKRVIGTVQGTAGEMAAVVKFLRERPEVDGERIGICGWSQGGFAALVALTERPGVKAAVAISAPHSARLVHQ
jgi:dienelactone hydrolase